jgi:hypothetical protein
MLLHGEHSNILEKFRPLINMKNEFLFSRLILAKTKKRYITSIRLQEGEEIFPEKVKVTGFDFMKSTTREETMVYLKRLAEEEILKAKKISIPNIIQKLELFEKMIIDSLGKGEKNFLIPKSVNELEAYKDPYREQGVRAVLAWNEVYPDIYMELPEKIDMVKVKLHSIEDAESLKHTHPEIYTGLLRIYNSPDEKIAKKGVEVIGLPRSVKTIPEWLVPYIDTDTIVNDNVSKFYGVLESLGMQIITYADSKYFSNLVSF